MSELFQAEKLNLAQMNVLYNPKNWSSRMCSCKVVGDHIDFLDKESKRARKEIPCQMDISYGNSAAEKLDIIGTDLPDDAPICFYIHGGFFKALSRSLSAFPALALHKIGIKVFAIDHALCPLVTVPTISEQVRRAFKFALNYARKHKSQCIHVVAHSSGAHLASYLLGNLHKEDEDIVQLAHKLVKHAVLITGIYDLQDVVHLESNADLRLTLEDAKMLSPVLWSSSSSNDVQLIKKSLKAFEHLNVHVVVVENDSPVTHVTSKKMFDYFRQIGLRCEYFEVLGKDHFDILYCFVPEYANDKDLMPIMEIFTKK